MGRKRFIWSTQKKHYWHISERKYKRINRIYEKIEMEKTEKTRWNQNQRDKNEY